MKKRFKLLLVCLLVFLLAGCSMKPADGSGTRAGADSAGISDSGAGGGLADEDGQETWEQQGEETGPEGDSDGVKPGGEAEADSDGVKPGEGTEADSDGAEPGGGADADSDGTEPGEGTDAGSDGAENGEIGKSDNDNAESEPDSGESTGIADELPEDGTYTSRDEVALYLHLYGHLPSNFITKKEAEKLGWKGGSLEPYAPGKCIGGNRFGNYEGLLPEKEGRTYAECDIDTLGEDRRGAKRIVFSNDGLIYYTEDHYESFELLYGEE